MPGIVTEDIERYALEHTTPVDARMDALAEATRATLDTPQMLSGAVEGRFLELLVFATGARRVIEFGTYSGYSALSMARALAPDGRIYSLEVSEEHAEFARLHIAESAYADRMGGSRARRRQPDRGDRGPGARVGRPPRRPVRPRLHRRRQGELRALLRGGAGEA